MTAHPVARPSIARVAALLLAAALAIASPADALQADAPAPDQAGAGASAQGGQETPPSALPTDPAPLRVDALRERIARIQSDDSLEPSLRDSIVAAYQQAIDQLTQAEQNGTRARLNEFEQRLSEAPGLAESLRAELSRPPEPPGVEIPSGTTLQQMEARLEEARGELAEARRQVEGLQREPEQRVERRSAISERLASIRSEIEQIDAALEAAPPPDAAPALVAARRAALRAERESLLAQQAAYERELAFYKVSDELQLLSARRDRAARRLARAEAIFEQLQDLVTERRRQEAERAQQEARRLQREAARTAPSLQTLAEEIQSLAGERVGPEGVTTTLAEATNELAELRDDLAKSEADFRNTRRRIEVGGFSAGVGVDLRRRYEALPNLARLQREVRERDRRLIDTQFRLIELEERFEREGVSDVEAGVQRLIERADLSEKTGLERVEFEAVARELLRQRREVMTSLIDETRRHAETLQEANAAATALVRLVSHYEEFIDERILWVRSATWPLTEAPGHLADALAWLLDPGAWVDTGRATLRDARRDALPTGLLFLGVLILLAAQPRIRRRLSSLAPLVRDPRTDRFSYTLRAIALTLIRASALPALLWFLGSRLLAPPAQTEVGAAAGHGLLHGAAVLFLLGIVWKAARPNGLAEAHFRWPPNAVQSLRRQMTWYAPLVAVLAGLVETMASQPTTVYSESLGRLAHAGALLATSVALGRLLSARGPIMQEFLRRNRGGWIDRLARIWRPLIVLSPIALLLLAASGYYYTTLRLGRRLLWTAAVAIAAALTNALLIRWLSGVRRALAYERWRQRQETVAAEGRAPSPEVPPAPQGEREIDIGAINAQTRQMFRSLIVAGAAIGLYLVWADVLPALRMLERVQLYPQVQVVEAAPAAPIDQTLPTIGEEPEPPPEQTQPASAPTLQGLPGADLLTGGGAAEASPRDAGDEGIVTLADLGLAIIIVIVTWLLARNVPGILEALLLQRLPLEMSARFAITTVARYVIVIVGGLAAFGAVNIGWSKVQWLAAALTFGLAFGLQEIFANFVSGLIILAERPMRVGDTVTVGDVSGTVAKIRMRATTIVDWDRKELIVPNKSFITNQLINWTLTEPILRITIPVGVAYGSDVEKVRETLLRVAHDSETILEDPKPLALFLGFGDSTLNFELRAFIPSIDVLLSSKSEMHFAIDKAFREEGITIAFPQRDLHIKSAEPLLEAARTRRAERLEEPPNSD